MKISETKFWKKSINLVHFRMARTKNTKRPPNRPNKRRADAASRERSTHAGTKYHAYHVEYVTEAVREYLDVCSKGVSMRAVWRKWKPKGVPWNTFRVRIEKTKGE